MWLSSTAQTALRAVLYIAEHATEGPVRVEDIAAAANSPRNYLSKTLHVLGREGVLQSTRGPRGGFELLVPPNELTLAQVIQPFAPITDRRCLMGRAECGGPHPCAVHGRWVGIADAIEQFFGQTTVADLLPTPIQITIPNPK